MFSRSALCTPVTSMRRRSTSCKWASSQSVSTKYCGFAYDMHALLPYRSLAASDGLRRLRRPTSYISGWLERRREATPLDSPLPVMVGLHVREERLLFFRGLNPSLIRLTSSASGP